MVLTLALSVSMVVALIAARKQFDPENRPKYRKWSKHAVCFGSRMTFWCWCEPLKSIAMLKLSQRFVEMQRALEIWTDEGKEKINKANKMVKM